MIIDIHLYAFIVQEWNDDFFLENLSGLETDCGLLAINEWSFPAAMDEAEDREINLVGQYGIALNQGSTRNAISSIFNDPQWKDVRTLWLHLH